MSWIQRKYVMLLSSNLDKFKQKSDNLWNFRCPLCKDSETSKNKARGYIYQKKGTYIFHCHNCSVSMTFFNFLKKINPHLYDLYIREKFDQGTDKPEPVTTPKIYLPETNGHLQSLNKVSSLFAHHPCKKYVISRQIPTHFHYKLFYCPKFKEWTNKIIPGKFDSIFNDEPRLIIPLFDEHKKLFGYQGRTLGDSSLRYITIILDEDKPRLYGLDTVDLNYRFYCFEGPIDSMFIENSVASCGGKMTFELSKLSTDKSRAVVVYDNEPRNKQIVANMISAGEQGYSVCVWPDSIVEKDINKMVLNKVNGDYCKTEEVKEVSKDIKKIIDQNTFRGLELQLKLSKWKKC